MRIAVNLRTFVKGSIGGAEYHLRRVVAGMRRHELVIFAPPAQWPAIVEFAPDAALLDGGPDGAPAILQAHAAAPFQLLFCPLLVLEPLHAPMPAAVVMPDILHEFFPWFFRPGLLAWRRANYLPSARRAETIITCSEYSKATIVERFDVPASRVFAIHHAADPELAFPPSEETRRAFAALSLPRDYLYYPANYWPHKNHEGALQTLLAAMGEGLRDLHLVFTGAPGKDRRRVEDEVARLGLGARVRFLDYQPRPVVAEIYRHARALLFLSLFEGFGLPVVEAMSLGVPVIAGRCGAVEEVAAGAAILVDPRNAREAASAVGAVLSSDTLRGDLVMRGLKRAAEFSWDRSVARTVAVLEAAASGALP
jgi:glycosyltransferase involved in cell wall biosynthesis